MNLYLHQVEPHITLGDSIYETPTNQRFDVILTNPPFGTKGSGQAPVRDDFVVETSNKQLNFVQHVMTLLKPGGRAAVVVPDNVLFADQAGEVFKVLMEDCNVHTVLRCPRGTFAPYTAGTKTNVLFFTKGKPTTQAVALRRPRQRPGDHQEGPAADVGALRRVRALLRRRPQRQVGAHREPTLTTTAGDSFSHAEIIERGYKIDSFKWLRDEELDDPDEILDPAELVTDAIAELQAAVIELHELQKLLADNEVAV